MNTQSTSIQWTDADANERFMGRWSRIAGHEFVRWLDLPAGLRWLDVGCGTGALTKVVLDDCGPAEAVGIDPAEAQLSQVRRQVTDPKVTFVSGSGISIPFDEAEFDVAVSGLVLNFISEPARMISEMRRVVRPGGRVALYVWDFAGGGGVSQHIAAVLADLHPAAAQGAFAAQNAGTTHLARLMKMFLDAKLEHIAVRPIDITIRYRDFDDYWHSNTGFTSPVARQIDALAPAECEALRTRIQASLPRSRTDGWIEYTARANAVQGLVPL